MRSYIAIVEASDDGRTWWISFPGFPGVTSAANGPAEIVSQARDALARALDLCPDDLGADLFAHRGFLLLRADGNDRRLLAIGGSVGEGCAGQSGSLSARAL